jgi:hypothetical protein
MYFQLPFAASPFSKTALKHTVTLNQVQNWFKQKNLQKDYILLKNILRLLVLSSL